MVHASQRVQAMRVEGEVQATTTVGEVREMRAEGVRGALGAAH